MKGDVYHVRGGSLKETRGDCQSPSAPLLHDVTTANLLCSAVLLRRFGKLSNLQFRDISV